MSVWTAKAQEISRVLADKLIRRGFAVVQSSDTDSCPTLAVGPGTAGSASAFIKVAQIDWPLAKDIFGLTSGANGTSGYGPEVVQLVTEANYAGTTDNVADILTAAQLIDILGDVVMTGCKIEWYQSANGTAPAAAGITSGNLKKEWYPDMKWGIRSIQ